MCHPAFNPSFSTAAAPGTGVNFTINPMIGTGVGKEDREFTAAKARPAKIYIYFLTSHFYCLCRERNIIFLYTTYYTFEIENSFSIFFLPNKMYGCGTGMGLIL